MKWSYKQFLVFAAAFCSLSFITIDKGYSEMFGLLKLDTKKYDQVYLMHFDFCSPVTKCNDTVELANYVNGNKHRIALIVDTLYSGRIPDYIKLDSKNIFFINRTWLHRKGLYTDYQQKLIVSGKGHIKRRILLK